MRPQVSWTTASERGLAIDQALDLLDTAGMRLGPSVADAVTAARGLTTKEPD